MLISTCCRHLFAPSQTTPFHTPVNPKQVPDYYRIVNRPMDLQTIREVRSPHPIFCSFFLYYFLYVVTSLFKVKKMCYQRHETKFAAFIGFLQRIRRRQYKSRDDFKGDIESIVRNSTLYNGAKSPLTMIASNMLSFCEKKMAEVRKNSKQYNPS